MTKLTEQDYFDKTVNHMVQQGDACMLNGFCVYRAYSKSCAVGYWIPEGHPAEGEVGGVDSLVNGYSDLEGVAWPATENGIALAGRLQNLHDKDVVGTEDFVEEVDNIRSRFKLTN
jgi:hypothetical protein